MPRQIPAWETGPVDTHFTWAGSLWKKASRSCSMQPVMTTGLGLPLKIAGSGPLQESVQAACRPNQVEFLGQQDEDSVRMLMRNARVLLVPSLWYEGLPMVVPEAFGAGLPIVASRIGSLETLIRTNTTVFWLNREAQLP